MSNPLRHWFCGKVRSPAEVALWALLHHKVISQPSLLCHKTSVLSLSGFLHRKYRVGIDFRGQAHCIATVEAPGWPRLSRTTQRIPQGRPQGGLVSKDVPFSLSLNRKEPKWQKTPSKPPPRRLDLKPFCVSQYNTCCQSYSWCDHSVLRLWHQKMSSAKMHIHHMLQLFEVCVCRGYPGTQQTPLLFFSSLKSACGQDVGLSLAAPVAFSHFDFRLFSGTRKNCFFSWVKETCAPGSNKSPGDFL